MTTTGENISANSRTSDVPTEKASSIEDLNPANALRLERSLSTIVDMLDEPDIAGVDEVVEITEKIKKISKRLANLKKIREIYGEKATTLSFSKITLPHVEKRLGVKIFRETADTDIFEKVIAFVRQAYIPASLNVLPVVYNPNMWDHSFLRESLQFVRRYVMKYSEASARVAIDIWLRTLINYLVKADLKDVLLFHELDIASKDIELQDQLVVVQFGEYVTVLSGSTDYSLLVEDNQNTNIKRSVIAALRKDKIPDSGLTFKYLTNRNEEGQTRLNAGRMLIIEAKRFNVDLEHHIPQVVAQCVALIQHEINQPERGTNSRNQSNDPGPRIPFCLTNNEEWIFGVIIHSSENSSANNTAGPLASGSNMNSDTESSQSSNLGNESPCTLFKVYLSPTLNPGELVHFKAARQKNNEDYHRLVETLIIWAKYLPHRLESAIEEVLTTHKGNAKD